MLRSDRLSVVRDRGMTLAGTSADRVTGIIRGRRKSLVYVGTALALAGAGSASAATVGGNATPASKTVAAGHQPVTAAKAAAAKAGSAKAGSAKAGSAKAGSAKAGSATTRSARTRGGHAQPRLLTWRQVRDALNRQTDPAAAARGQLPSADRLVPVDFAGPQAWMTIGRAQEANAATIVRRTLHKRLGIRSAVVAVATAMQESMLHNINYGDAASLGLFQQQPDCGWGTAAQIMNPVYASDAFLNALRHYQERNPGWARQPLWRAAQSVQRSAFPFAYAKWEAQAAHLVQRIAMQLA